MNPPVLEQPPPIGSRLAVGTLWMVGMRWGMRLLGILSMVVLARILDPADFGLVAMAMAVIAIIEMLTNFGVELAVIRDKHAGDEKLNTAWTVRLIQYCAISAFLVASAPLAAAFFDDSRLTEVVRIIAVGLFFRGFENIGLINFQRNLEFSRDFRFRMLVKVLGTVATVGMAIVLRSYYALVYGMVLSSIISTVLSYKFSAYRPRFSFSKIRVIWDFSQWVLIQGLARYLYQRFDVLVIGRLADVSALGAYSVSSEIADLVTTEISMPVSRAIVPGFAQLIDDEQRLTKAYLKGFGAVASVALPLGIGLSLVSQEIVLAALGSKWVASAVLLKLLALFAAFRALSGLSGHLLVVIGKIKLDTIVQWSQALVLLVGAVPIFYVANLNGLALLRGVSGMLGLILVLFFIIRNLSVRPGDFVRYIWRPSLATISMAIVVGIVDLSFDPYELDEVSAIMTILAAKVIAGGLAYSGAIWFFWNLAGKPDGIESLAAEKLGLNR